MPRTLTSTNTAGIARANTEPSYIVEMGFSTPLRLSSRGAITYNSNTYSAVAKMDVQLSLDGLSGSVAFFNTNYAYSDEFRSQGTAGRTCKVWIAYDATPVDADWDNIFSGEMGQAVVAEVIKFDLVPPQKQYTPRWYARADTMRHLPRDGMLFETENGTKIWRFR